MNRVVVSSAGEMGGGGGGGRGQATTGKNLGLGDIELARTGATPIRFALATVFCARGWVVGGRTIGGMHACMLHLLLPPPVPPPLAATVVFVGG